MMNRSSAPMTTMPANKRHRTAVRSTKAGGYERPKVEGSGEMRGMPKRASKTPPRKARKMMDCD